MMKKQRSGNKIVMRILATIAIPIIIIFLAAQLLFLNVLKEPMEGMMERQIAAQSGSAAFQVSEYFTKYIEIVKQMAANTEFDIMFEDTEPGGGMSQTPRFESIMATLKRIGASDVHIDTAWLGDVDSSQLIQSDGAVRESGWEITQRPFYEQIMSTKDIVLTEPYQDSKTQQWIISVIQPIYKEGASAPMGIDCVDIEISQLDQIMSQYQLGVNGYFMLITPEGQIMHHPEEKYMNQNVSEIGLPANVIENVMNSQAGALTYQHEGENYIGYLSNVGNTGWSVLSSLPEKEFRQVYTSITLTMNAIFFICGVIIIFAVLIVARSISKPIKNLAVTANEIAEGAMEVENLKITNDEVGQVADAFDKTVQRLKQYMQYINETTSTLNKIAEGRLNYTLEYTYEGEFKKIKEALMHISEALNATLVPISDVASTITDMACDISKNAEVLSSSTNGQKASVDTITMSIAEISQQVQENAQHSIEVTKNAEELGNNISKSSQQMNEMKAAMTDINEASGEIGKIIKTIEDIAFQTNILALNAAVEAARAGNAGKGFAVVADEVRNLANKSSEAAKNTTALIEGSLRAVSRGTDMADETAETLQEIVKQSEAVVKTIDKISLATTGQAKSIYMVTQNMEQISSDIQNNADAVVQSEHTARDLTKHAQTLKDLLSKFELHE